MGECPEGRCSMVLSRVRIALTVVAGVASLIATTAVASAQQAVLPGANQFVSGLDLECFSTPGPSLDRTITLKHLNPVLVHLGLPTHNVIIRELQQTCVPVQKNGFPPSAAALPFIQHVDLACYRIETPPLPAPVSLTVGHLNPVMADFEPFAVTIGAAVQLCLPVIKNNVLPPPEVRQLVQFIDLECYRAAANHPSFGLNLKQLNPQLGGIPPHDLTTGCPATGTQPCQLCVPVQKNAQAIPPDILNIVQWIDLQKFPAQPIIGVPPNNVVLRHINPLFTTLAGVPVTLQRAVALMQPVSKNGVLPPPP
jgi:hypothetical protein